MSDAQVQSEVMGVLRTMFPKVAIPKPMDFLVTRWFNDPLYRGSYSTWAPSFVPQHQINLGTPVGPVFFAGEATSVRFFGRQLLFVCFLGPAIFATCGRGTDDGCRQDTCTAHILRAKRQARRLCSVLRANAIPNPPF